MSGSGYHLIGIPSTFSRAHIMPYCHRVQKYDCITTSLNPDVEKKDRSSKVFTEEAVEEVTPVKKERSINLQRFNAEEWRLKRCRQKAMNLVGVDENTRRLLASSDDSNSDVSKNGKSSQNNFSKISFSSEKSENSSSVRTNLITSEAPLPRQNPSAQTQKVNSETDIIPAVKMRQKYRPEIREQYPREKVVGADDDPVVKLREKVKLIQDRVGKVLENIVIPDTPTVATRQKETKRNSEFDMDAWRREREKIRNSRFFEEVEVKPYERKLFIDTDIRPSWETRNITFRKEEEIVEEVVKKEEVKIEPVIIPEAKQVQEKIVHQSGPKFDSKNLHRAKSIHYHSNNNNSNNNNNGSQESRNETRKASLPHITISSPIVRPELFKKKPKKDLSWTQPPEEGVVSDEDVAYLRDWLESFRTPKEDEDPLAGLEGSSKRITSITLQRMVDPYLNLWGESYTVDSVQSATHVTSESLSGLNDACEFKHGQGEGVIIFKNGDRFEGGYCKGRRLGKGKLTFVEGPILSVEGNYNNDILEGRGFVTYLDGEKLHCSFEENCIHGFAILYDKSGTVKRIGRFVRGVQFGLQWNFLEGGGFTVGRVDVSGSLSGEDIAFIYPDLKTALVGTFIHGQLLIGQTCFVRNIVNEDSLLTPTFTLPAGPQITPDQSSKTVISANPLLPDPYEYSWVYVRTSRIKGASEGLFAKQDIPKDRIVSFYGGIRMRTDEMTDSKEDYDANAYKIMDMCGPDENGTEGILDIPPEFRSLKAYCATLAHKTNHSFDPNAKFFLFDHPRFGRIPSIKTLQEISKDEEITVSYDYALEDAPPWYQEQYSQRLINMYQQVKAFEA